MISPYCLCVSLYVCLSGRVNCRWSIILGSDSRVTHAGRCPVHMTSGRTAEKTPLQQLHSLFSMRSASYQRKVGHQVFPRTSFSILGSRSGDYEELCLLEYETV
jgi:hypothetical protein